MPPLPHEGVSGTLPSFDWYLSRLRAMRPSEALRRLARGALEIRDRDRTFDGSTPKLRATDSFPSLPLGSVPDPIRSSLRDHTRRIRAGRITAFGSLDLELDDPPRWQRDPLSGIDVTTSAAASRLDPRELPVGADVRAIWELNRWHPLVRLAQESYADGCEESAATCLRWLQDWDRNNRPFQGWNWTSALETGIRLIQIAWIDAMLRAASGADAIRAHLDTVVQSLVPAHVWFTYRYRSFGSSANNHLLGELAGLITALARWPQAQTWSAPLRRLARAWEREVLLQFAEDGGNREQALNYHLFALELCLAARSALAAAGEGVSPAVVERLRSAADFYSDVQMPSDPWDYGDSDGALVTPWYARDASAISEWCGWLRGEQQGDAIAFWLGPSTLGRASDRSTATTPTPVERKHDWTTYHASGLAVARRGPWTLRFDASPLGYLGIAAHGHLDALHLSLWHGDAAVVVDPGTGAYYADPELRAHLASRRAHNGPAPVAQLPPHRRGVFLWSHHHAVPVLRRDGEDLVTELRLGSVVLRRRIRWAPDGAIEVIDDMEGSTTAFIVHWQLAPRCILEPNGERKFIVRRGTLAMSIEASHAWEECATDENADLDPMAGVVAPGFRRTEKAPFVRLLAPVAAGQRGTTSTLFRSLR